MKRTEQDAPFSLHLEPTEGCTLACSFCAMQAIRDNGADAEKGIHGARSTPYRFMTLDLATRIASEVVRLNWNPRIEFDMRGEPTVNPALPGIIRVFRDMLPKHSIAVTTNGSGVMSQERIVRLFDAGLNTLAVDDYKHSDFVKRMRKAGCFDNEFLALNLIDFFSYPADKDGNPHRRYKGKRLVLINDISDNTKGTHKLTNQAGNSFGALQQPLKRRCAKPFRELAIRWDGNVPLCCDDWRGEYKIANVMNTPLDEVWNHPRFEAGRTILYHGRRDLIRTCAGCGVVTYRDGLLPDKYGKQKMPRITQDTLDTAKQALRGKVWSIKLGDGK